MFTSKKWYVSFISSLQYSYQKISTITSGSIFGEDELLNEIPRRYIAKVSTLQAEVYQIEEKKFFTAIKETSALPKLIDLYESKLQWREDFNKSLTQSMISQSKSIFYNSFRLKKFYSVKNE